MTSPNSFNKGTNCPLLKLSLSNAVGSTYGKGRESFKDEEDDALYLYEGVVFTDPSGTVLFKLAGGLNTGLIEVRADDVFLLEVLGV